MLAYTAKINEEEQVEIFPQHQVICRAKAVNTRMKSPPLVKAGGVVQIAHTLYTSIKMNIATTKIIKLYHLRNLKPCMYS